MKRLITLFFVILIAGCAMAQKNYDFSAECESGQTLYYEITSSAKPYTVEVVSELNNRLKHYNTYPTGNIIIPQYVTYNGEKYSVTRIGIGAFGGCSGLTSITIPNSVTIIGDRAFSGCTGLTSIIIPESVTSIKNDAFAECSGLSSISIPNSVTSIGSTVFNNTAWYNTQPDGILILDGWCVGYKGVEPTGSLTIQEGIKGIANRAFIECSQLTSISIPNTTKIIGEETFYNCSKLTSISIPNSVTSIGERAFSRCNGLISVTIPKSVTNIGEWAFGNVLNVIYDGNAKGRPWGARTVNGIIDDGFVFSDSKKQILSHILATKPTLQFLIQ